MTRAEFLRLSADLVGRERGTLRRVSRLLGASEKTVYAISDGTRPVPAALADSLREAAVQSHRAGACLPFVGPRLHPVVQAGVRAGWSEAEVLAAIAAWAGLGLSGDR